MKVLVTGAQGLVGRAVVADLLEHGYDIVAADVRPAPVGGASGRVRNVTADLGDVGQVTGLLAGCDGVIHMAAIPRPYENPDEIVFINNVRATFAVLQAATLLGIRKAVIASSISALGTAWAPVPFAPLYAPVDESHPFLVKDAYGLSKEVDERTAEMFHRRTGMQIVALRFHWVSKVEEAKQRAREVSANPRVGDIWKLFWGYVDVRDAATSSRLGLEVDGLGFEPFMITAADTISDLPTEELIRREVPEAEIRRPLIGYESAFSIEKARRLLGYEPKHSWRE